MQNLAIIFFFKFLVFLLKLKQYYAAMERDIGGNFFYYN